MINFVLIQLYLRPEIKRQSCQKSPRPFELPSTRDWRLTCVHDVLQVIKLRRIAYFLLKNDVGPKNMLALASFSH